MNNLKSRMWRHGRRVVGAVEDKEFHYWTTLSRGFVVILLLLATGGWIAPVVVVAAPATPTGGATFNITWGVPPSCETPPAEAVTALDYAASLWGTWISSTVPIEVTACWKPNPCGSNALGCGGPMAYGMDFPNAPFARTNYPIALANALSGRDHLPGIEDITLEFNANIAWSFELTPTLRMHSLSSGQDFVTIALHELAHGLGFIGNMYERYNVGFCLMYCPTPYDQLAVDSEGVVLLSYLTPDPRELAARLRSDANFGGANTIVANSGTAAKLYAPGYWSASSLSHLDEATYQYTENSLMTPVYYSGATRHPGPVTLGIFQDMGWLRADGVPNVATSGPWTVGVGNSAVFSGTLIWPAYTGQPITYTWKAADQLTVTHPSLTATDNVTFTWNTPGEKRITLTATDGSASASATRAALVYDVTVSGPALGQTNHAYTFDAEVTLYTLPVTWTWEATDQPMVTHPNQYQSDSVTLTWLTPGAKTITITATIGESPAQAVHTIAIEGIVFNQFVFLPLVQRQ